MNRKLLDVGHSLLVRPPSSSTSPHSLLFLFAAAGEKHKSKPSKLSSRHCFIATQTLKKRNKERNSLVIKGIQTTAYSPTILWENFHICAYFLGSVVSPRALSKALLGQHPVKGSGLCGLAFMVLEPSENGNGIFFNGLKQFHSFLHAWCSTDILWPIWFHKRAPTQMLTNQNH